MSLTSPDNFYKSLPSGFDGLFDWDFLMGVFPRKIMPHDIDAVVEIGGRFLCWETKDPGKKTPNGQRTAIIRHVRAGLGRVSYLFHAKKADDIADPIYVASWDWSSFANPDKVPVAVYQSKGGTYHDVIALCKLWATQSDARSRVNASQLAELNWEFIKSIDGN